MYSIKVNCTYSTWVNVTYHLWSYPLYLFQDCSYYRKKDFTQNLQYNEVLKYDIMNQTLSINQPHLTNYSTKILTTHKYISNGNPLLYTVYHYTEHFLLHSQYFNIFNFKCMYLSIFKERDYSHVELLLLLKNTSFTALEVEAQHTVCVWWPDSCQGVQSWPGFLCFCPFVRGVLF